jgi:signal transduction histidine kinase
VKKIIYATATKAVAVILFIACITTGLLAVTQGITRMEGEDLYLYRFENSFYESDYMQSLLYAPQYAVISAYYDAYRVDYAGDTESPPELTTREPESANVDEEKEVEPTVKPTPDKETMEVYIREALSHMYCADKILYFVEWNGTSFQSTDSTAADDLIREEFYIYIQRDQNGVITTNASHDDQVLDLIEDIARYDTTSTITVCAAIRADYVDACRDMWTKQAAIIDETMLTGGLFALGALLLLIYLVCVCGKNGRGEPGSLWVDYIWSELHLVAVGGTVLGAAALYIWLLEEHFYGYFPLKFLYPIAGVLAALTAAVCLTSLLSVIRNIKARRGIDASLILSILRLIWRGLMWVVKRIHAGFASLRRAWVRLLSRKTGVLLVCSLFVYTALIGLCGIFAFDWRHELYPTGILMGIVLFLLASFAIAHRSSDLDEIKKGVREVRSGNVTYQITSLKGEELKPLADNVNGIAQGLDEAVSAKLKAERMKAELITNVSHDLKTPLTSIINYTELLSQVEGLPEEARDYVRIIAVKNERLKNLTQDLFAISKVQSGNEEVVWEKLNIALLLEQALAEHDNEIRASELPFCINVPKDLYISADGRKMSRVIGNLINNILKYTMKHTRVFITATEKNREILLEFKNISAYPMDFDADEIMGRFVRGDESRTTEGSGLGLAIVKSYTELCGGRFEIFLDGDMFKAVLTFPAITPEN